MLIYSILGTILICPSASLIPNTLANIIPTHIDNLNAHKEISRISSLESATNYVRQYVRQQVCGFE